jgi:hypothetical protein
MSPFGHRVISLQYEIWSAISVQRTPANLSTGRFMGSRLDRKSARRQHRRDGRDAGGQRAVANVDRRDLERPVAQRRVIVQVISAVGQRAEQSRAAEREVKRVRAQRRHHRKDDDADRIGEVEHDCRPDAKTIQQDIAERRAIEQLADRIEPSGVDNSKDDKRGDIGDEKGHDGIDM